MRKGVVCAVGSCDQLPTWYVMAQKAPEITNATPLTHGVELTVKRLEIHAYCCDEHQHCVTDELRDAGIRYLLRPWRPFLPRWLIHVLVGIVSLIIGLVMLVVGVLGGALILAYLLVRAIVLRLVGSGVA